MPTSHNQYYREVQRDHDRYARDEDYRAYIDEQQRRSDQHSTETFSRDLFKRSADAMNSAALDETVKFLGFEVDAGLAAWLESIYNISAGMLSSVLIPRAQSLVLQHGPGLGLEGNALVKSAAVAGIGVTVLTKTLPYFSPIKQTLDSNHAERVHAAHSLAPVLDQLKGKHTLGAFYAVKEEDNEVIFAQRKRLEKIHRSRSIGQFLKLGVNAANILPDFGLFGAMWRGQDLKAFELERRARAAAEQGEQGQMRNVLSAFVGTSTGQLADRLLRSNEHALRTKTQPYSAMEMIVELANQVATNPKSRSFQTPKSLQNPTRRGESYALEEYIARILIQHQKDMAAISPDHTEIREALQDELAAAARPIAEAIRSGQLSPLSLIRLVGEGKIIKNRGRSIADPEDVRAAIEQLGGPQAAMELAATDAKIFYKNRSYTRADLKNDLAQIDGASRREFLALFPGPVLEEAGVSSKEIKDAQQFSAQQYHQLLAQAVLGLAAEGETSLKASGATQREIKHIMDLAAQIEAKGDSVISGAVAERVAETIGDRVVPQIKGKPEYFGRILEVGQRALAQGQDDRRAPQSPSHAQRHQRSREEIPGLDESDSFGRF